METTEKRRKSTIFKKNNLVVKNTQHAFSGISVEHVHEQNNKLVKGDGEAIGLTEIPHNYSDGWCLAQSLSVHWK